MSDESTKSHYPVIIIGSGPAGLTAALYTARGELQPLVIGGREAGGQLMLTSDVENYPGFPSILGPELMAKLDSHAQQFGAKVVKVNATTVDFTDRPFQIWTDDEHHYTADAVILATGATAKWLGLESETRLRGRGVSSCATCDGFFFKGKELVVVGGGDTALEDATFLTKFASRVTLVHRRDELRASKPLQKRARENPKIEFIWDTVVAEVLGDQVVAGVKLKNVKTGAMTDFATGGLFVAIGHVPNTKIFAGQVDLDAKGYIVPTHLTYTNVEGVFVAGDVEDARYRQAVTAAGSGCAAAIDAERWLMEQGRA